MQPGVIPPGWSKGEPLMVEKLGETCYRLVRSGRYLQVPGAPLGPNSVPYVEFNSRVEMVEWQRWWDNPEALPWDVDYEVLVVSASEYLEFLQELHTLKFRNIRPDLPNLRLRIHVPESQADELNALHFEYCSSVERILFPDRYRADGTRIPED